MYGRTSGTRWARALLRNDLCNLVATVLEGERLGRPAEVIHWIDLGACIVAGIVAAHAHQGSRWSDSVAPKRSAPHRAALQSQQEHGGGGGLRDGWGGGGGGTKREQRSGSVEATAITRSM
jgi:hypothetical protein